MREDIVITFLKKTEVEKNHVSSKCHGLVLSHQSSLQNQNSECLKLVISSPLLPTDQ